MQISTILPYANFLHFYPHENTKHAVNILSSFFSVITREAEKIDEFVLVGDKSDLTYRHALKSPLK